MKLYIWKWYLNETKNKSKKHELYYYQADNRATRLEKFKLLELGENIYNLKMKFLKPDKDFAESLNFRKIT